MNTYLYEFSRWLGCLVAKVFFQVRCIGFEQLTEGPYLLVCNHISHFDPPFLVAAMRSRFHFMTWDKLFSARWFAAWLHGVGCFPVHTTKPDLKAARTAVRLLQAGKIVGLFPEGGIRSGVHSILEQAPLRRSVAGLAHLGGCPVRVCMILGSDQLYDWKKWFQRPEILLICGEEFTLNPALSKKEARLALTHEMESHFRSLYRKAFAQLNLAEAMIPQTAHERMKRFFSDKPGQPV